MGKFSKGVGISKDQRSDSGNPCILYGELYTHYKSEVISEVRSKTNLPEKSLVKSVANDIIIPASGETAKDIATARCVPFDNVFIGGDLNIIRLSQDDGRFISYQLNGVRKYDIAKVAQGVSVVHLHGDDLKGILINVPSILEQNKIAEFLSLIDERIAIQNKIIERYQSLIRALRHKLLDAQRNEQWSFLGKYCTITTGKLDANAMTEDGEYMFFTCARENYKTNSYAFEGDALLISGNGELGLTKRYSGKFNAYQRTYVLQSFKIDIDYAKYAIEEYLPRKIYREKNVGAMPYIVFPTLSDLSIPVPEIKTQKSIVDKMRLLEKKTEVEQKIMSNFQIIKHFLLSYLFI